MKHRKTEQQAADEDDAGIAFVIAKFQLDLARDLEAAGRHSDADHFRANADDYLDQAKRLRGN